jgi:hypothetical protein
VHRARSTALKHVAVTRNISPAHNTVNCSGEEGCCNPYTKKRDGEAGNEEDVEEEDIEEGVDEEGDQMEDVEEEEFDCGLPRV